MRLKRVRIQGFKTFADRTEVQLDGGLIAVLGPNGCGKSNLVDAILWGLGEGNARQLRAQSSQDVIFSGSSRRKGVGFAEVSLFFDNEDGGLPLESPEVQITRKLTRNGDSEYSINRQHCRLRDILELLADSGLGRAGYAIVGQKEIDQALAASAEDRRAWIDEAAGVQRYRARKQESLRRLAQAQDHLSRIGDILSELESQREPLKEEAEVARRFKTVQESLQSLEVDLLATELQKAMQGILAAEERIKTSEAKVTEEAERSVQTETQLEHVEQKLQGLRREREQAERDHVDVRRRGDQTEAEAKLRQQRIESLRQLAGSIADEAAVSAQLLEEAEQELEAAMLAAADEEARLEAFNEESGNLGEAVKLFTVQLRDLESRIEKGRQQNAQAVRFEAEARARGERAVLVRREIAGIDDSLPQLKEDFSTAQEELQSIEARASEIRAQREAKRTQAQEAIAEVEKAGQELRKVLAEIASLEGRIRGIENTIESHEGLSQGARAVMEAVERGILKGSYEPVSSVLRVDQKYALAIETALGASQHDLIVESDRDAKEAIRWLKEHRAGRCTFQPIPLMRPVRWTDDLLTASRRPGILGSASSLVEFDSHVRPVIESLLGRVLIADDIDSALAIAKTTGWSRIVTLDGEVVQASGAVTGGMSSRTGFGIIQRTAELEALNEQEVSLAKRGKALQRRSEELTTEREKLLQEAEAIRPALQEIATEADDQRKLVQALDGELKSAMRSRERLAEELAKMGLDAKEAPASVDLEALDRERDELLKSMSRTQADAEGAEARLREMRERARQERARADAAGRRLKSLREQTDARQGKREAIEPEIARLQHQIGELEAEHAKLNENATTLEGKVRLLGQEILSLEEQVAALTIRLKDANSNRLALQGVLQQAEIDRARSETARANAAERLLEEYGVDESLALEKAHQANLPSDAAQTVSRLRRELRAMGDVNLGAIEAYDRLTARLEELSIQKEDVEGGIEQVLGSIRQLDTLTRDQFTTTYHRVREEYQRMFVRLFGGGEGDLRLTDPDNLLESGIEIDATLPGKRRQQLQLLSGGERSLCATAFLFALLAVKPSPLVVLDEVDAPLDGRNVERFADLLLEFSQSIQFIIITHNPTTMERAPVWLGVTMDEPGVSTLIPSRLPMVAT